MARGLGLFVSTFVVSGLDLALSYPHPTINLNPPTHTHILQRFDCVLSKTGRCRCHGLVPRLGLKTTLNCYGPSKPTARTETTGCMRTGCFGIRTNYPITAWYSKDKKTSCLKILISFEEFLSHGTVLRVTSQAKTIRLLWMLTMPAPTLIIGVGENLQ